VSRRDSGVVFVIAALYAFLLVPLGCFVGAAAVEIRAPIKGPAFPLRILEIVVGIVALWATTVAADSEPLSWRMVVFSLLLGGISLVSRYASPGALFCVLYGCGVLAFLWYFKGAYHHEQFAVATLLVFLLFAAGVYGVLRYVVRKPLISPHK
jgi:hypothetical protein